MSIYIFFGAIMASIVGFNVLRGRLRDNINSRSLKKQEIALETAQELRAGEKLEDEASLPVVGQLPNESGVLFMIKAIEAISYYHQKEVADGYSILSEAQSPKERYYLNFSKRSSDQSVITLDYRDNIKEGLQFGVVLVPISVHTESITLQIFGSEAHRFFFKKENNRFVIIRNDSSKDLRVFLAVTNFGPDKKEVIKNTKFQPIVISPFTNLAIHYFEAESSSSDYVALATQVENSVC